MRAVCEAGMHAWAMFQSIGTFYFVQQARTERYNRYNSFDFNVSNPLSSAVGIPLKGGLVFLTPDNRGLWDTDPNDLAPRIGTSFKVTDKLVVRAGYGISYQQTIASVQGPNIAPEALRPRPRG